MKLQAIPCPCGCPNFIVRPLFGCQCSSLSKEQAQELVRRWNHFEEGQPSAEAVEQAFFGDNDD